MVILLFLVTNQPLTQILGIPVIRPSLTNGPWPRGTTGSWANEVRPKKIFKGDCSVNRE